MPADANACTETAESIVEHAGALARLGACASGDAVAAHVQAMRVLAAAYVDPVPDRAFHRALTAAATRVDGVFVRFADGALVLIVDGARQHRIDLLSPAQAARRGDDPYAP